MTNDLGELVHTERQQTLIINSLFSHTTNYVNIDDKDNLHQHVLKSHVMISSVDTSLAEHLRTRKLSPIDPLTWSKAVGIAQQRLATSMVWVRFTLSCVKKAFALE
jgi:hypothetical protein